jgi:hypothetical protein
MVGDFGGVEVIPATRPIEALATRTYLLQTQYGRQCGSLTIPWCPVERVRGGLVWKGFRDPY